MKLTLALTLAFAPAALAQLMPLPASVKLKQVPAVGGTDAATLNYQNDIGFSGFCNPVGAGVELSDDLHRISPDICGFDFIYYGGAELGTTDALVNIYASDPFDGGAPSGGAIPIATFPMPGLPVDPTLAFVASATFALTAAPADIWFGVTFFGAAAGDDGVVIFEPPTIGSSHDLFDVSPGGLSSFGPGFSNYGINTYVPAPGAAALLGLAGLVGLRRRR